MRRVEEVTKKQDAAVHMQTKGRKCQRVYFNE